MQLDTLIAHLEQLREKWGGNIWVMIDFADLLLELESVGPLELEYPEPCIALAIKAEEQSDE